MGHGGNPQSEAMQARQKINEMLERIESGMTHYELLGVEQDADRAAIGRQFRQLAREWHVDRFSQFDLGDDKAKVQQIFSAINTANQILSNEQKRADYDAELAGESAANLAAIFQAETLFVRGKNMLQQGSYSGAASMFEEAYALTPDDQALYAHKIYVEYLQLPKSEDGRPLHVTRAQEIYDELDALISDDEENDWLFTFAGTIALGLGKTNRAKRYAKEALYINKDNRDAQRLQRLIEMRARKEEESKGWWAKLKERFGG